MSDWEIVFYIQHLTKSRSVKVRDLFARRELMSI